VAAAKSAAQRVEREMESRTRGVQGAHQEFIRQMEQRHEDEKTEFLQLEVQFQNELAAEKERNCELAEVILRLQKREWKEAEDRDAVQQRLEEQQKEYKTRWEQLQKNMRAILEKVDSSHPKSRDNSPDQKQGGNDQQDGDGSSAIKQTHSVSSDSSDISSSSTTLLDKLSQVVSRYNKTEKQLKNMTEDLQSRETMVQQLNDLVHEKGQEIQSVTSHLQNATSKNQAANNDLRTMGALHKEAVQELYSFKNEMNRLKRRSENQQQQLQETRRKLELRERRMEKVKGLVASLSLHADRWDLDPEESLMDCTKDNSRLQEAEECVTPNATAKTDKETTSQNDPNIGVGMEKIQNISTISMDQSEGHSWVHNENYGHAVHVSDDEGNDDENVGLDVLDVLVLKLDKSSEDCNETAVTTKVVDDEVDEENMSFFSQRSSSPLMQGIGDIRPIDSDLI
jgi:chromosome segregation ATPase